MAQFGSKHRTIFVAGRGETAGAVVNAVASLPGVSCVRQIGEFDARKAATLLAGGDVLVEMVGGVSPAFTTAMAALSQGMACITANPLLVATHGRVLQNAARGQQAYFGFQAAGFGMPVGDMMAAVRPSRVTASFVSAASMALARMAYRNESLAHVSAHLKMQKIDLSDWSGKVTQARAMALRALWCEEELRGSQLGRVGIEQVEPADLKRLREFGLQPVFGAEITEEGIYTGPLAVAPGSPLLSGSATVHDVLIAETEHGEMLLTHGMDDVQRVVAGVVADVRQFLRTPRPALKNEVKNYGMAIQREPVRAYVRVPYAAREVVLGAKPEILSERVDGDGLWQAVMAVETLASLGVSAVGGMIYPVSGEWEMPVAGGGWFEVGGVVTEIFQLGAEVIRRKADAVTYPLSDAHQHVIEVMVEAMREANLVGIAAPQVGESVRIFVTEIRPGNSRFLEPEGLRVFINPGITRFSDVTDVDYEGCGSVAGGQLFGEVERALEIEIVYADEKGVLHTEIFSGFLARVIQHEYDHLNGVVFTDKLDSVATLMSASEFRKIRVKQAESQAAVKFRAWSSQ